MMSSERYRIILHGRNRSKVKHAVKQIEGETGNRQLDFCIADLSSLHAVRTMAAGIRRKYNRLDVLINNAGLAANRLEISDDGYEMTFAVNYLAAAPEPAGTTGAYFSNNRKPRPAAIAFDPEVRQKLWDFSEKLCGMNQPAGLGTHSPTARAQLLF